MAPYSEVEEKFPSEVDSLLREWDGRVRAEMSFMAPAYEEGAALWAAGSFYRACQLVMDREPGEAVVREALASSCPAPRGAATDYSVDLVFRFLPDLLGYAEQRAPGDAAMDVLRGWAREWPLSSVGLAVETAPPADDILGHPSLRRLYLDRIFERRAKDRMADPRLRRWLEADAGPHAELEARLTALAPVAAPAGSANPEPLSFP